MIQISLMRYQDGIMAHSLFRLFLLTNSSFSVANVQNTMKVLKDRSVHMSTRPVTWILEPINSAHLLLILIPSRIFPLPENMLRCAMIPETKDSLSMEAGTTAGKTICMHSTFLRLLAHHMLSFLLSQRSASSLVMTNLLLEA